MELGKRLMEIRKQHNMTQEDLAENFHVTRQTISNWENGKSYPDIETLICISDTFQISLDTLLKGDKEMVREITKEQISGRKQKRRIIAAAVAAVVIVLTAMWQLEYKMVDIKPEDYRLTVKEITLDDVTVYEDKQIAVYEYPVKWDDEDSEKDIYTFDRDEYAFLTTYGKAYAIMVSADKRIDGWELGCSSGKLEFDVYRTMSGFWHGNKDTSAMTITFDDFDEILDGDVAVWSRK